MGLRARGLPGVVLAAGRGARFSSGHKLIASFHDQTVIYHSVCAMINSMLEPVILVVGFEHERVLEALGELRMHPKLQVMRNERWATGLASSVRTALEHLPGDVPGAVFLPGDMPLITSALIDRVAQRFLETERPCFPIYQGRKGHPTGIPRALLPELRRLEGDIGALSVVKDHWKAAQLLELSPDEERTQLDLDTEEDYRLGLRSAI
jgi:molybdenum cofactor cytidylyltransferase